VWIEATNVVIAVGDSFDVHELRHRLKQLSDGGDSSLFENRDGVDCPVCGGSFDRVFVTRRRAVSFPEHDGSRFCLLRDEESTYLFRH